MNQAYDALMAEARRLKGACDALIEEKRRLRALNAKLVTACETVLAESGSEDEGLVGVLRTALAEAREPQSANVK